MRSLLLVLVAETGISKYSTLPRCFALYNEDQQIYGGAGKDWDHTVWTPASTYYDNLIKENNGAATCIACGACMNHCPQHLEIPELLKTVARRFEP